MFNRRTLAFFSEERRSQKIEISECRSYVVFLRFLCEATHLSSDSQIQHKISSLSSV